MKNIFFAILSLASLSVLGQNNDKGYVIKGKLGMFNTPAKIYLAYFIGNKAQLDSVELKDGAFEFRGQAPTFPAWASLTLNPKGTGMNGQRDRMHLYIEQGNITVNGNTDSIIDALAEGTPTNNDNNAYNYALEPVAGLKKNLNSKVKNATKSQLQSQEFEAWQQTEVDKITSIQNKIDKEFVSTHPASYISLQVLTFLVYDLDYKDTRPLFDALTPAIKATQPGRQLAELSDKIKSVSVGALAPDFTLTDTTGKAVSLSSFRGKYVLVDFWASWCAPCRKENPNVVKVYQRYKNRNFTILGVSLDGKKEQWLAAIRQDGLSWTQVSDLKVWKSQAAQLYALHAIPTNILLDPDGKIIAKNLRGINLEKKLSVILANKPE